MSTCCRRSSMTDLTIAALPGAELDEGMLALDRYASELGAEYRAPGAALDRDPDALGDVLGLAGVRFAQYGFLPPAYRPELGVPAALADAARTCLGGVVVCERYAHGDPGVILASP